MNRIKNDWWRIQEEQGIELMLRMNGMTAADVQIVEFPYADDWYNNPAMLDPMETPPSCGSSAITSATWPSVPSKPRWKRALLMPCIVKAES